MDPNKTTVRERTFSLMKSWCDNMLQYQITEMKNPLLYGTIICPCCANVHGRIADLVFPLMLLYRETGEERYREAAERLVDWSEYNILCDDGVWKNDVGTTWKGISAFSAMALGNALHHFGDLLSEFTREKWMTVFLRLTDGMLALFERKQINPVINYYAGMAALLAMAGKMTGRQEYFAHADRFAAICDQHFDGQGLLYGEWSPPEPITAKGCQPIDMGYDLEESIPLLVMYAVHSGKEDRRRFYAERMLDHMEFLLPDGAIDNSWGKRHNKWTYWGSRTSDGLVGGLVFLTDLDPVFALAADRVLALYERCTFNGEFYAGLMQKDAGEPACIHHAFAHAKALAELYLHYREEDFVGEWETVLPREKEYPIKEYQNGNVLLISHGSWRATVSAVDGNAYPGGENFGGGLNLLWHPAYGAICAATMHSYAMSEPCNMQLKRKEYANHCHTTRLICGNYSSDTDRTVQLTHDDRTVTAAAEKFTVRYAFERDVLTISLYAHEDGIYVLPIIADSGRRIVHSEREVTFGDILHIKANTPMRPVIDIARRQFNQVGGFEYYPLHIPVKADQSIEIKLMI